nr:MAG TPA: hypothetical protein [Caudoviricetes sp.]
MLLRYFKIMNNIANSQKCALAYLLNFHKLCK